MNKIFIAVAIICSAQLSDAQGLVKYVNTLQGTDSNFGLSYGSTYPTVSLPFGEHFYSAQTGKNGDGWKYQYSATTIRGFQQVHQCSPWMGDYNVFSLMPVEGTLHVDENERAASFKHENEIAKPSYYKVKFDNGITTEISPVERGSMMRFSFKGDSDAYVIFDGFLKTCDLRIIPDENKIIGYVRNGTFIPGTFKGYFVIQFDQPFESYGTYSGEKHDISKQSLSVSGTGVGAYFQFKKGAEVQVRMASSYISQEQAQLNLEAELKYTKLEQVKKAAEETWNNLLGRIDVDGGTEEEKNTFYSCFFRSNLFSRKFFDFDKEGKPYYYSPYDEKIHQGYMYTDNGFWDTFRTQFPLDNIIHPAQQANYMQSLLDAQKQCGFFPAWSNPGMSGVMLGNHAISLLADAWVKGIRNFDPKQALDAYYHETTNKGFWGGSNGREGWKEYFTLGYVPFGGEVHETTAKTLEYAYDDFCAYNLAKMTGNEFYMNVYGRQMYNYKNVYDPAVGFMRGRLADGSWRPDFDPTEWGGPFTEGNSWQYTWSVFQDIAGLVNLMGGEKQFADKLDTFFSMPSTFKVGSYKQEIHEMKEMVLANMGQYAHGNQPCMHVAYLYNYVRQPWKTQAKVREVMEKLYNAGPKGFPGDEDQGAMSSWYVMSAMGLYSVCPGTDQYVLGSPVFDKTTITLENGKKFTIVAKNNSKKNVYIKSAVLNGKPWNHNFITHSDVAAGGELMLEMSDQPNRSRGIADEDKPFSLSK